MSVTGVLVQMVSHRWLKLRLSSLFDFQDFHTWYVRVSVSFMHPFELQANNTIPGVWLVPMIHSLSDWLYRYLRVHWHMVCNHTTASCSLLVF